MLQVNNMIAYNKDTAIDLLIGLGFDRLDVEEMIDYLSADALDELAAERAGDDYELIADGYYQSITNAVNMIDGIDGGTGAAYNISMDATGHPIASCVRDCYLDLAAQGKQNEIPIFAAGGIGKNGNVAQNGMACNASDGVAVLVRW